MLLYREVYSLDCVEPNARSGHLNIEASATRSLLLSAPLLLVLVALCTLAFSLPLQARNTVTKNGFILDAPLVPEREILQAGPPRDGIPAIDKPQFVSPKDARYLQSKDRVLGVVFNGEIKAYPIRFLNFHEVVNDNFGQHPVVITYCPLCGTGMAFDAFMNGQSYLFGVSGLLYNSDLLMYDRNTESLWSQLEALAINGTHKGLRLPRIPVEHTTWADWLSRFPNTQVLSSETGYWRDYASSPYPGYASSEHMYFPVASVDKRYHPKESVLGVDIGGHYKAYPFVELDRLLSGSQQTPSENGRYLLHDVINKQAISVEFNPEHRTAVVRDANGVVLPSVIVYWFAWAAFYPKTQVYRIE